MLKKTSDAPGLVIASAEKYLGYQCRPGNVSVFGETVGYNGLTWSGSFIDVVFREAGFQLPACVYSPSGLAEFIRQRAWRENPQPGDVVFFNFATDDEFGMLHVGLVADAQAWRPDGYIQTIEANIDSGLPKAGKARDGVYRRVRTKHEVLGFGRPGYKPIAPGQTGMPEIHVGNIRPGKRNKQIELVQRALVQRVGMRIDKDGLFDGHMLAAYAHYQRIIGFVGKDANGIPDIDSLQRLGRETGAFTAVAS
jgi:hypothetical protein